MKYYNHYSIKEHHTFGTDTDTLHFVEYNTVEELNSVIEKLHKQWHGLPWLHIGSGSNLLFVNSHYPGVIIHSAIGGMEIIKENDTEVWIRVGAGVIWDKLVAYCVQQGWGGMENLSLIPGEVGSSAIQNIGAYGIEAKDLIEQVEAIEFATSTPRIFQNQECQYAYRQSIFKNELKNKYIVTHVTYRLQKRPIFRLDYGNIRDEIQKTGKEISLQTIRETIISIRNAKLPDPQILGNAGSFFMNPIVERKFMEEIKQNYPLMPFFEIDEQHVKIPAGWLIEQCGWKGRSLGKAAVHKNQALVLINTGGATGKEIVELSEAVRTAVKHKFNIEIYPEVNFIDEK